MTGSMVLNRKTQYARRCDLCHKPVHQAYEARFEKDSPLFIFCSGLHLNMGQDRYMRNKKKLETGEE